MAANIVKKPGPPVPPRPQHTTSNTTSLLATALRTPTNMRKTNIDSQTKSTDASNNSSLSLLEQNSSKHNPPIIHKKPIMNRLTSQSAGRTVIYKSPTISMQQRQEQIDTKCVVSKTLPTDVCVTSVSMRNKVTSIVAPKPPLKLRKAPDVPKLKPPTAIQQQKQQLENSVTLNRHNSMGCTSSQKTGVSLKESRLSLGRVDLNKMGKIQLNQLQLSQPLPKPRKIVQMPIATMDLDMEDKTTSRTNSMANIFRRSKTTLDNIHTTCNGSNGHITNHISTPNRFLSGKTVEIKNNLKNAAERLFAEIIVSQHNKHSAEPMPTIITKHERAIQHMTTMTPKEQPHQHQQTQMIANTVTVAVNNTKLGNLNANNSNCTRICINPRSPLNVANGFLNGTHTTMLSTNNQPIESILNSPEKKQTFHEILISELAAMRSQSSSIENLQTKYNSKTSTPKHQPVNVHNRLRCNSVEEFEEDDNGELIDHDDNIDDLDMDEDLLRKKLKLGTKNSTRKRCPSGCSSDSSPYGTERSARIRTSDWIEVQDNGKQVTLTSCHISLEDSGLEDEERLDDMSTSGVGDSWDSVKETQNEQRMRNIKR